MTNPHEISQILDEIHNCAVRVSCTIEDAVSERYYDIPDQGNVTIDPDLWYALTGEVDDEMERIRSYVQAIRRMV